MKKSITLFQLSIQVASQVTGFFFNSKWLRKVPILYFVKYCEYCVPFHYTLLRMILPKGTVLYYVCLPCIEVHNCSTCDYFKLMTNLRLFINYKKHDILPLFVISWCRCSNKSCILSPPIRFTVCLSLFEEREIPSALTFVSRCLNKRKRYSWVRWL